MKYLADLLTLTRFILGILLFYLAIFGGLPETAFIVFLVAVLTDAFDGTCARKWPFPKNKTPKYRKYAAKYDMVSDALLAVAQVLFLTLRVNLVAGVTIIFYYFVSAVICEVLIYGKVFGHPDDCADWSLAKRNFPLAKKIVLARRYIYTICLGITNALILFATSWSESVKYSLFAFGCLILIFLWFFLRQRRENISRDAVDIEKKLSKKSQN